MNDNKKEGCGKVKKARETLIKREICHPKALLDAFLPECKTKPNSDLISSPGG